MGWQLQNASSCRQIHWGHLFCMVFLCRNSKTEAGTHKVAKAWLYQSEDLVPTSVMKTCTGVWVCVCVYNTYVCTHTHICIFICMYVYMRHWWVKLWKGKEVNKLKTCFWHENVCKLTRTGSKGLGTQTQWHSFQIWRLANILLCAFWILIWSTSLETLVF